MIHKFLKIVSPLLILPLLLIYLFSTKKDIVLHDLYSRKSFSNDKVKQLFDVSYELLTNSYFRTLFYFRNQSFYSKILRLIYPKHTSFIIDRHTKIGKGLQMAHPYATILNAEYIGENVYINHLVTIGEKNGRRPIIGDNVQIHAHAIIIGGIVIGKGAVVGAGSVVVKDVPPGAIVVGNPAKIIS